MDTYEDCVERKEQEKNDRYSSLLGSSTTSAIGRKAGGKPLKPIHHRSTRLVTHKPVPYETGVARCKEQKHARSPAEYNGPKNPLYVGHNPQVFFNCIKLQDRFDTSKPTYRNRQQEHGEK